MAQRFPGAARRGPRARACARCTTFDDAVTAPLHGFAGAHDYWRRASSKPWLAGDRRADARAEREERSVRAGANRCPDPRDVERATCCSSSPTRVATCGFMVGPFPGRLDWLPQRLLHFFPRPVLAFVFHATNDHRAHADASASSRNLQGLRHPRHRRQDAHAGDRPRRSVRRSARSRSSAAATRSSSAATAGCPVPSSPPRSPTAFAPRARTSSTSAWSRRR